MYKFLRKLFLIKEIISKTGEIHFRRYRLFWSPWFAIYIHRIFKADEDDHLHSHPWDYITVILQGGYKELFLDGTHKFRYIGSVVFGSRENYHKVQTLLEKSSTSLFFTFGKDDWGYLVNGKHVDFQSYRSLKRENKLDLVKWDEDYSKLIKKE